MDNQTGVSEDYKAMVEKLEVEKRGMYAEMKTEREKRQAMEEELGRIRAEVNSVRASNAPQDENLAWITDFAKNGKTVLRKEFEEYSKPLRDMNSQLSSTLLQREAMEWLAEEEGTTVSKLKKTEMFKDLERIGKEKNLGTMPLLAGTQAAYEFLKIERKQKEEEEKKRNSVIQGTATQSMTGTAPASSNPGRVWKESEIAAMDLSTFQHYVKDITLAKAEGRVVLDLSKPNQAGRFEVPKS